MRFVITMCLIYVAFACTCWPTNTTKVETVTETTKYWGTRADVPACASVCTTLCGGNCVEANPQNFTHTLTFLANSHQFSLCETSTRALVSINSCDYDTLDAVSARISQLESPHCEIKGSLYAVSAAAAALLLVGLCGFCACTYSCLRTYCGRRKPKEEVKLEAV